MRRRWRCREGVRLSFAELEERVAAVAGALMDSGIEAGDRVAVWAPNGAEWMLAALGALNAGGVLVPVSTRFTGPEALDVISRSGARALFVAGDFLGVDRLGAADVRGGGAGRGRRPGPARARRPGARGVGQVPAGRLAGAGPPARGGGAAGGRQRHHVHLGHHRAEQGRDDVARAVTGGRAGLGGVRGNLTQRDRYLVVNPFFHTFGYKAGILACLVSGAALVPQPVFDAGEAMRLVAAERITVLPGAPTIYQMILDHPARGSFDLSSLRLAVTGAADVPVALIERMRRELTFETVLTAYGLTEAVVATMCCPGDPAEVIAGTSGRAAAGFEVRIGPSEEILLRGPNMMLGYAGDPEATAAAIDAAGLAAHRRRGTAGRRGQPDHHRPAQGHVHLRRVQRVPGRGGAGAGPAGGGGGLGRGRRA